MISPSDAQIAERCGYYVTLKRRGVPTTSAAASFGAAFAALVAGQTEQAKEHIARLDKGAESEVLLLAARYMANMPRGAGAQAEWEFALLPDGTVTAWDDPKRVTRGRMDAWWREDGHVLVVRDDKTGVTPVPHPSDNLQFGVYAKALGAAAWGARLVGEIANPKTETLVRYEYQPGEVEALWQRFLKADAKSSARKPLAEPGGHCADCWERQRCDARLLPAMQPAAPELAPFMAGGPALTSETAAKALRVVQAMGDVVERAEEQLRAFVRENGPIRDGAKEWAPTEVAGRKTADVAAIEAAGLEQFIRRGKPYTSFRWRNAR